MPADPAITELAHRIAGDRDLSECVAVALPLHTLTNLYRCLAWLGERLSDSSAYSPRHAYIGDAQQRIAAALREAGVPVTEIAELPQSPE